MQQWLGLFRRESVASPQRPESSPCVSTTKTHTRPRHHATSVKSMESCDNMVVCWRMRDDLCALASYEPIAHSFGDVVDQLCKVIDQCGKATCKDCIFYVFPNMFIYLDVFRIFPYMFIYFIHSLSLSLIYIYVFKKLSSYISTYFHRLLSVL